MFSSAKYSSLKSNGSCAVYFDEVERKEILSRPQYGLCDMVVLTIIFLFWVITLPVSWWCSFKIIPQFERVIVFRLGRVLPLKGPGLIYIIPCVDKWRKIDMRMRAFKVPPQEIITIDRAILKVGADVQYRIANPITAYTLIQDIDHSLRITGHAALNSKLCYEKLSRIQAEKSYLESRLQSHMNKAVSEWGIEIARFELTHIIMLKGPGGVDPHTEANQEGGGAAIMNLLKSFTSSSSSFQMPGMMSGMMPPNMMSPGLSMPSIGNLASSSSPSNKNQPSLLTPNELFSIAKGVINDELCQQTQALFEFHVTEGIETSIWTIDLKNSPGYAMIGPSSAVVDVKFELNIETFQKIFYGQMSPTDAYMNGSLVVDGSLQTAMKLENLIRKLKGN